MTATAPETRQGTAPTGPGSQPPGRRERKKQRTREALVDAAFTLFAEKGFDATTVEEIASAAGVSPRTFTRRLAAEGVTFLDLVEALRRDLANRYLADDDLSISQIAWFLGYREVGAFSHAFKRWTGYTPRKARALRAAGG